MTAPSGARLLTALAGLAAALALAAPPAALSALPPWISVAEIRPGMRGEARTVVRGVAVEPFDVEVLSIVPGAGPAGDLILIRASGPLIRQTGGIAAGMSGSPVYFNGRLAGAIGFGWTFADHSLGLVTPIADMMRVLPGPRAEDRRLPRPVAAIQPGAIAPHVAAMVPLARPLLLSGLSPRAGELMRTFFEPLGISPVEGATGTSTSAQPPLVPGSAIGVQLMRGDLNAVAIGTLTYRKGDEILAFGHPFLNRGRTGYLLTPAVIYGVVQSAAFPFKIGSAGAPVGIITEDRRAAIGGRLGSLPPLVAIRAIITDRDRGRTVTVGTQVLRDTQLGPALALGSAIEAMDRALDRVGEGTARVRMTLRARGLDGPVVRENVFYHPRDIGSAALLELPEALRLLFANEFVRTGPVDVTIQADVEESRQTATVTDSTAERHVRRAEALAVRVTLRPFQGEPVTRTVDVAVPEGFPLGPATVLIRAGGRPVPEQGLSTLLAADPVEISAPSAAAQLATFADRERNTDLIVELIPGAARLPDSTAGAPAQTARTRVALPWVVRGRIQLPVIVDAQ